MSDQNVTLSQSGPPETILDAEDARVFDALAAALAGPEQRRREEVAAVVAANPRFLAGWAALAGLGRDPMETYAANRVGYHRGLDRLRANGWRGSGYVRWAYPENQGFLRCVHGLALSAAAIGEADEADRCELFLRQLDPDWPPAELT